MRSHATLGLDEKIVLLDQLQRRWLERLEPDPVRRELLADKAREILRRRVHSENRPLQLHAWLWKVVVNLCKTRVHVTRTLPLDADVLQRVFAVEPGRGGQGLLSDWLREHALAIESKLSPRLARVFRAAMDCASMHSLARSVNEDIGNVRRALASIARRIRVHMGDGSIPPPPLSKA